jgi:LPXTG-motif cell wall-anchored protein
MKSLISMKAAALLCGIVLTAGIAANSARADEWSKRTILTVSNQPIQIRDTVLQPGQYVLRLLDSQSDRHIVQIFNSDQTHIINTVLAIPAQRNSVTGHTQFTFWETPPGTAKAMRTWFYPGDEIGQEFPYPKHLQQIAMAVAPAEPEAAPAPPPEPQPEAAAPPAEEAPAPAPEPVEPPQQPEQPAPAPAPPAEQPAQQLPTTGSPYPLVGLGGIMLLGLFGLLRLKRTA